MYYELIYKEAIKKLHAKNNDLVLEGIKMLREAGKPQTVKEIIKLLSATQDEEILNECAKFLMDVKDQKSSEIIVDAIKDPGYDHILATLISVCWQSSLDFSNHLDVFVDMVLSKDYLTAYEAFTVIENNASNVSREKMDTVIFHLKRNEDKVMEEKKLMVHELITTLEDIKEKDTDE